MSPSAELLKKFIAKINCKNMNINEAIHRLKTEKNLIELCIGDDAGDNEMSMLAEAMASPNSITSLDLSYNRIGWKGIESLVSVLTGNKALAALNLSNNNLGNAGVGELTALLQSPNNITDLDLSANSIGVVGAARLNAAITSFIAENAKLQHLNLSLNELGSDGALALSPCIRNHPNLISIKVRGNHIEDAGIASLVEAAVLNKHNLSSIDISENEVGERTELAIAEAEKMKPLLNINSSGFGGEEGEVTDEVGGFGMEESGGFGMEEGDMDFSGGFSDLLAKQLMNSLGITIPSVNDGGLSDTDEDEGDFTSDSHVTWGEMAYDLMSALRDTVEVTVERHDDKSEPTHDESLDNHDFQLVSFVENPSVIASRFDNLLSILHQNLRPATGTYQEDGTIDDSIDELPLAPFLSTMFDNLPLLKQLLHKAPNLREGERSAQLGPVFENTAGKLAPRCGIVRIKICRLISSLIRLQHKSIDAKIIELGILHSCIELFFQFHWNTMLHSAVQSIIQTVAQGASLDLKIDLIQTSSLLEQLMAAHEGNKKDMAMAGGRRRGYMGFVHDICHMLTEVGKEDAAMGSLFGTVPGWREFVDVVVSEVVESNRKPLGGPTPVSPEQLYAHDPNSIIWSSLANALQGFGMSGDDSEEEEEEEEENMDLAHAMHGLLEEGGLFSELEVELVEEEVAGSVEAGSVEEKEEVEVVVEEVGVEAELLEEEVVEGEVGI